MWELTRKISDIEYYLTESLKNFNKAKKGRETREQRQAQYVIDNKQHENRKGFQHQAEAEISAIHDTPKYMTAANKALRLEKEHEDTIRRGEEFAKWQMESEKLERIRAQKAATDAKRDSNKEIEIEKSRIRLEADRVISQ